MKFTKLDYCHYLLSWYAVKNLMLYIDRLDKVYYCPLKTNYLVDDTFGK